MKKFDPPVGLVFRLQVCKRLLKDGERPSSQVQRVCIERVGRLERISLFRTRKVELKDVSAALFRSRCTPRVCEVVLAAREEISSESAAGRIGGGDRLASQEVGEETLGRILGIVNRAELSSDECVNWVPVSSA